MTETNPTLSLGQQLQKAREALNLSLAQVAEKTNLKKNHLEALEQDIFILPNVPPAFVRGYVGSYLRFLRLPEELVNSAHYGEVKIPKEVKRAATIPVKNNHKSQTRWVKCLTWLVLLGAIGMTLAWWWQEHKKEQASSEQLVVNVQNEVPPPATESVQPQVENAVPVQLEPKVEENAAPTVAANNSEATQAPVAAEEVKVEVLPQAVEQVRVDTPQPSEPVNVLQVTATAEEPKAEEQKTEEQPQAVGNDELRIEITNAQSWITVRGAKNKKLAEKLYNSGEVLTFNGNEQYRLTVGAPANVKIYYKGELVPLKVDGRVARFKLPLAN